MVIEGDADNKKYEGDKSENEINDKVKGWTLNQFIDNNSPYRRTKKHILIDPNYVLPDYIKTPYPFLKDKHKKKDEKEEQFKNFKEMFRRIQVNIPFYEAMDQMLVYAKFIKELLSGEKKH